MTELLRRLQVAEAAQPSELALGELTCRGDGLCARFADGRVAVSGGSDGVLRTWELPS